MMSSPQGGHSEERARDILGLKTLADEPRVLPVRVEHFWRRDNFAAHIPFTGRIFMPMGQVRDLELLRHSIASIIRRHDALHTRLAVSNGHPVQIVDEAQAPELQVVDVTRAQVAAHRDGGPQSPLNDFVTEPIDLYAPQAGFQCRAFRDEDRHVTLGFLIHHFFGDAWSSQILRRELALAHAAALKGEAPDLPPVASYGEYALAQRRSLEKNLGKHLAYWQGILGDERLPRLPYDIHEDTATLGQLFFTVPETVATGLRALSSARRLSPSVVYLAAFQLALARWSGEKDIVTAVNAADRIKPQFRDTVGFLMTSIPVYSRVEGEVRFGEFASAMAKDLYGAYAHQDLASEIYEAIFFPDRQVFPTRFNFVPLRDNPAAHSDQASPSFEGIMATPHLPKTAQTREFHLGLVEYPKSLIGKIYYDTGLFTLATAEGFVGLFKQVLERIVAEPDRKLAEFL